MLGLLLAAAAPLVSPEVTWRVTSPQQTYFPAPQAAPLAADGPRYAVTWSEVTNGVSHACAGTLGANGHLEKVGVCTSGTGDAAIITPSGDGYVAAWLEPEAIDARPNLITAALDGDFKLRDAQLIGLAAGVPSFHAGKSRLFLATPATLYELDATGAVRASKDFNARAEGVAVSGDEIGTVFHARGPAFSGTVHWVYSVTFARLGGADSLFQFGADDSAAVVALGANDDGFLVLWSQWGGLAASFFGPGFVRREFVSTNVPATASAPQVAWDGARWLVVWSDWQGVRGTAIAPDLSATPFLVSSQGSRPAIAASSPGHFIVTYEVVEAFERRLAARAIDFNGPRVRSVR
jgi:hypothetical protein